MILIFYLSQKLLIIVHGSYTKQNINLKLIHDFDSKFELQPNIGKVHRLEKDLIIGPNGDKIGLVFQDLVLSSLTSEIAVKSLSVELEISEEEIKNMLENLTEEFKQTKPKCIHVRYWAQKQ